MALDRLAELDSHGLSNVAWSFAVARMNGTGTQVATVALEILPDFQAQGGGGVYGETLFFFGLKGEMMQRCFNWIESLD